MATLDKILATAKAKARAIEDYVMNKSAMPGKTTQTPYGYGSNSKPHPNVLNNFASFNCLFTLSALSNDEIIYSDRLLSTPPHHIIAQSGGIGAQNDWKPTTDISETLKKRTNSAGAKDQIVVDRFESAQEVLNRKHDIYFENVTIESINRPNEERKLTNFNKLEIELVEPHGITLFEKLRAAALANGFIDHLDAPFLLTLDFKGTNEEGVLYSFPSSKRVLPIKITNCEMEFSQGFTRYQMKAVPWTEFALTDRFDRTRGSSNIVVYYAKKLINAVAKPATLRQALVDLADELTDRQQIEIDKHLRKYKDIYKITCDPNIFQYASTQANYNINDRVGRFSSSIRPNMSIAKCITELIMQTDEYKDIPKIVEKYWTKVKTASEQGAGDGIDDIDVDQLNSTVPWFKIVTNVKHLDNFDPITKMQQKLIEYHVIPYGVHVLNFVVPGMSPGTTIGKTVKKHYDYIFTGSNTEVLNLDIYYKYGYYQARLLDAPPPPQEQKNISLLNNIIRYFGSDVKHYPESQLLLRSYPSTQRASAPTTDPGSSTVAVDEFYDYLTNPRGDMVNISLKIMGDPAWVGQDGFLPLKLVPNSTKTAELDPTQITDTGDASVVTSIDTYETVGNYSNYGWDDKLQCFNVDQAEPLITLDFKFPTDIDERKGIMDFAGRDNVPFKGLYKVVKVTSEFVQGSFTQTLDCVRLNNQGEEVIGASFIKEIDGQQKSPEQENFENIIEDQNTGPYGLGS